MPHRLPQASVDLRGPWHRTTGHVPPCRALRLLGRTPYSPRDQRGSSRHRGARLRHGRGAARLQPWQSSELDTEPSFRRRSRGCRNDGRGAIPSRTGISAERGGRRVSGTSDPATRGGVASRSALVAELRATLLPVGCLNLVTALLQGNPRCRVPPPRRRRREGEQLHPASRSLIGVA